MNYFGHFYFDGQPQTSPELHLGLVLPDFIRNFTPQNRLPHKLTDYKNELYRGCASHFNRDKIFHSSQFFKNANVFVMKQMDEHGMKKLFPRYWFLSHIMMELILDRVLLRLDKRKLEFFYKEIFTVLQSPIEIEKLFLEFRFASFNIFIEKLAHFCNTKYIFYYSDNEKLIFSLNRIYLRTTLEREWDSNQHKLLLLIIPQIELWISNNIKDLYLEMDYHP